MEESESPSSESKKGRWCGRIGRSPVVWASPGGSLSPQPPTPYLQEQPFPGNCLCRAHTTMGPCRVRRQSHAWFVGSVSAPATSGMGGRRRKDRALADPLPYVDGFEAGFGFHRKRIGLSGLTGRIFESFFTNGYAVSSALAELPRNGLRNSAAEANCRRVFGYRASKSVVSIRNGIMYMITLPMTLPPTPVPCAV